jgi:hypothetical protein
VTTPASVHFAEEVKGWMLAEVEAHVQTRIGEALHAAADDIQALHPGEVKNSVIWLRDRAAAHRPEGGT